VLCQLSYAPVCGYPLHLIPLEPCGGPIALLCLAMLRVLPTARAELLERQSIRIVPLVLLAVVVPLLAVAASQRDEQAIRFLRHSLSLPRPSDAGRAENMIAANSAKRSVAGPRAGAHGEDRTHDLTLTKGVLYH
jgi:hypothetical protein